MQRNHEVTKKQPLLNKNGNIAEPGWARKQLWDYHRKDIKASPFRIKEWDYYLVTGKDFAGAFTISDDGYIGLQSVSLLNFSTVPREHTETVLSAFPMGKLHLPETSAEGDTVYEDKRLQLRFEKRGQERHITCHFEKFLLGKPFDCDITLHEPDMDSMVIATPWDKKKHFYYNQKINCMPAQGWMEYDGTRYEFDPATDYGTLDWGRGVWTYDNTWLWSNGNATVNGKPFGFNLGYGFGNTSAATENIFYYDGKATKLDDVEFVIPETGYTDPWVITSHDGRFEMDFIPVLDRAADLDFKILISDQHQVFGKLSGTAVTDDGEKLEIRDLLCFAEKVHNRY